MLIQYAVSTTAGMFRAINEDNYYLNGQIKKKTTANVSMRNRTRKESAVFAVSDGLGGESCGEEASFEAVCTLKKYGIKFHEDYLVYLNEVNKNIRTREKLSGNRMACTFAALSISHNEARIVNIGDSRVYLFRNGELFLLSKDHSEFQTMLDFQLLKPEEYYTSEKRNSLTRCIGYDDALIEPNIQKELEIQDGDLYLLCSDGFCGTVRNEDIKKSISSEQRLLSKCESMVHKALELGSDDNITVMLVQINME